jgi:hypothetical protein
MKGSLYAEAVEKLGRDFVDHNIDIWTNMLPVLNRALPDTSAPKPI